MEIKNIKKAAKRIIKAVKNKENIIIYGDSDLDGIVSSILLEEVIKNLGGEAKEVYFPDREEEGYGLSQSALDNLKQYAPSILVCLDCGIGNFKEVKIANKMGFEVIIIDHHEILEKLPEASIIVDPKQKGDKYPFKNFANAGLVFKFAETCLGDKMTEALRKNFLEITAMATIADMMPKEDENEIMISEGINYLQSSWRPGIQALLEHPEAENLKLIEKVYKINSILNIRDIENKLPGAFRVLTAPSKEEAKQLVNKIFEKAAERRARIAEIKDEVKKRVEVKPSSPIIFEGDAKWDLVLLGVVASPLSQDYKKPVFLYKRKAEESVGSVRCPDNFNVVEPMKKFSKKLITYGGHRQAAGFRVKNENLEDFEEFLMDYFENL